MSWILLAHPWAAEDSLGQYNFDSKAGTGFKPMPLQHSETKNYSRLQTSKVNNSLNGPVTLTTIQDSQAEI